MNAVRNNELSKIGRLLNYLFHFSDISYQLVMEFTHYDGCRGIEIPDEAIVLYMRNSSSGSAPWIPLQQTYYISGSGSASGSDTNGMSSINGYSVSYSGRTSKTVTESVHICGDLLCDISEVQFRWLGSVEVSGVKTDVWALANVTANLIIGNKSMEIFRDTFGSDTLK